MNRMDWIGIMNVDHEQMGWIREINFAVSHYGNLVFDTFIRQHGKSSLRSELWIAIAEAEHKEAEEDPDASILRRSKYCKAGPLDSYAVEIAKNHIRDLRNAGRTNEWTVITDENDEPTDKMALISRRPEETEQTNFRQDSKSSTVRTHSEAIRCLTPATGSYVTVSRHSSSWRSDWNRRRRMEAEMLEETS
jgi:hypothetical protein